MEQEALLSWVQLLPEELIAKVIEQAAECNLASLCLLRNCNRQFRNIIDRFLLSKLEELDARSFRDRSKSCVYSVEKVHSLKSFLQKCVHIIKLELTRVFYAVDDTLLGQIANSCSQLKVLDLSYCYHITDKGISSVLTLSSLQVLTIRSCPNITSKAFQLCSELYYPENLTTLNIEWCPNLSYPVMSYLIKFRGLKCLSLRGCESVSDDCFRAIAHSETVPCLQYLDIRFCMIGDAGLMVIARLFRQLDKLLLGSKTHNLWPCGNWTLNGASEVATILPWCKIIYS
ncbi:hypothetical protein Gasu2_03670 [Galdieria sulphuraria]|uniref:Uncharacterized protein n=1 Tax=Galdieria sulphuraria TaxID=130081 RepID=M2Y052_GALSU|nr:uncharacterized protein Gasu_32780 [Galdieria sulphuraria]EME29268.1 hypothetical protein Gasu_32780 [Galdieria sulphuraria]GJD05922.1 hypothetical protein Gasu2_03670 [Galdieria sulphuraria]|eukprot:XP_005705788.1 hypothetical protein Gasu_32780 [Galdieria sulphuraria]